jgi:hypothetical protein
MNIINRLRISIVYLIISIPYHSVPFHFIICYVNYLSISIPLSFSHSHIHLLIILIFISLSYSYLSLYHSAIYPPIILISLLLIPLTFYIAADSTITYICYLSICLFFIYFYILSHRFHTYNHILYLNFSEGSNSIHLSIKALSIHCIFSISFFLNRDHLLLGSMLSENDDLL